MFIIRFADRKVGRGRGFLRQNYLDQVRGSAALPRPPSQPFGAPVAPVGSPIPLKLGLPTGYVKRHPPKIFPLTAQKLACILASGKMFTQSFHVFRMTTDRLGPANLCPPRKN
jgi:hypothetical protein